MKLELCILVVALGLSIGAQTTDNFKKEKTSQDTQKVSELSICFVGTSEDRTKDFEGFFTEHKIKCKSISFDELSKDSVKDYDIVIIDPANGKVNKYGQTDRPKVNFPDDLNKPVIAIGAAGSYAVIPLKLKFGNNG